MAYLHLILFPFLGDEKNILKRLLLVEQNMWGEGEQTSSIWQHVADYADLVNGFYAERKTLLNFPRDNIDVLEKIICVLTEIANFEELENYSLEIDCLIIHQIYHSSLYAVKRIVNVFNYDVSKKSGHYISAAIFAVNSNVIKWLINEKSCVPEEYHLRECFTRNEITEIITTSLRGIGKKNHGNNYNIIEKLELRRNFWTSRCIEIFEIIETIAGALEKLEPRAELSETMERFSEKDLLECLYICGRPHYGQRLKCFVKDDEEIWDGLHSAAWRNDLTAINSMDQTLLESKTIDGKTPLVCAVLRGACEATRILLEKYSADVNAMDDDGCTPLAYAIKYYKPSIVKILLSHGAKTCWKTESGVSVHALHEAVKSFEDDDSSEPELMFEAILVSDDCDVSARDANRNNVLHLLVELYYATKYKPNHRVLQSILRANSSLVNQKNKARLTPFKLAKKLLAKFTCDHWHAKSLRSFILELDQLNVSFERERRLSQCSIN